MIFLKKILERVFVYSMNIIPLTFSQLNLKRVSDTNMKLEIQLLFNFEDEGSRKK